MNGERIQGRRTAAILAATAAISAGMLAAVFRHGEAAPPGTSPQAVLPMIAADSATGLGATATATPTRTATGTTTPTATVSTTPTGTATPTATATLTATSTGTVTATTTPSVTTTPTPTATPGSDTMGPGA